MAQASVASYFNTRKRPAVDDISAIRSKVLALDAGPNPDGVSARKLRFDDHCEPESRPKLITKLRFEDGVPKIVQPPKKKIQAAVRKTRTTKKSAKDKEKAPDALHQGTIVKFIRKGPLSPRKRNASPLKSPQKTVLNAFSSIESLSYQDRGMKTPTKVKPVEEEQIKDLPTEEVTPAIGNASLEQIKKKIVKSSRLAEIRSSIKRIDQLDKHLKAKEQERESVSKSLKEFKTIELEILSPTKQMTSSISLLPASPQKLQSTLMSPRKATPQKLLFSPTKLDPIILSPVKIPAYQKYSDLAEAPKAGLQLPYKYRCISEMFRCCESVVAMFHNRRETISYKKLKPAVQRLLRKNFNEDNLAQIQAIYPDAYTFTQEKMRNFGSASKYDTYQLVIKPNVAEKPATITSQYNPEDNIVKSANNLIMNPHVMIQRQNYLNNVLTNRVKAEHEKFLAQLDPPMFIARDKLKRWHPDFDLETCPDVEKGQLPQPPNVEKFSCAKDILSTARNLFNCGTPMEKVMARLEAKRSEVPEMKATTTNIMPQEQPKAKLIDVQNPPSFNDTLLKGVPKSLLERIRAKQNAKALDAMTRRPSQDQEATKYSRLPDLVKHVRNVFVTERKSILPWEIVLEKLSNSYRGILTNQEFEAHLKLIEKEFPTWMSFQEIRKTRYLKICKETDINVVISHLAGLAEEKAK